MGVWHHICPAWPTCWMAWAAKAAARAAGMERQTLRDWVQRFDAEGAASLRDQPRPGRSVWLTEGQQTTLKAITLRGPDPDRDGISTVSVH